MKDCLKKRGLDVRQARRMVQWEEVAPKNQGEQEPPENTEQ